MTILESPKILAHPPFSDLVLLIHARHASLLAISFTPYRWCRLPTILTFHASVSIRLIPMFPWTSTTTTS